MERAMAQALWGSAENLLANIKILLTESQSDARFGDTEA